MRRRASTRLLAALLPLLAFASYPAYSAGSSLSFTACPGSSAFGCASLAVPLDRSGAVPGTIALSVERKLGGSEPSHDAVIALAGGPGQAVLPLGEFIAEAIAPALRGRDLLLFDQRGTGSSGMLSCLALSSSSYPGNRATGCAQELGSARRAYTTAESVEDIEAVRQAAGYEKLILYGTSYGTKVALDYAERYPQNVEALVLDSTETPNGPEPFLISTFKAITPVLQELCANHACAGISSDPVADLASLNARLRKARITGYAYDGQGKRVKVAVTYHTLYSLLLAGDLNPALRAEIPAVVHAAISHDPAPLLHLVALLVENSGGEQSAEVDEALFVDTSCEETPFPWQRGANEATRAVEAEAALDTLPASDFYPFDPEAALLFGNIPLCFGWPDASSPPPAESPLPDVPTLILSGDQDLRTPTENARHVAASIPDAQVLTVPYTGHSVIGSDLSGCAHAALISFFGGAAVAPCTALDRLPPVPLPPRSLAQLSSARGLHGLQGRTVTAVLDTLRDLRRSIIEIGFEVDKLPVGIHIGGLRGGSAALTKSGVALDRLSYVPGVQLSGHISTNLLLKDRGASASLSIAGSGAAGHLRISSRGKLLGVLTGERFAITVPVAASIAAAGSTRPETEWLGGFDPFPLPARARLR